MVLGKMKETAACLSHKVTMPPLSRLVSIDTHDGGEDFDNQVMDHLIKQYGSWNRFL